MKCTAARSLLLALHLLTTSTALPAQTPPKKPARTAELPNSTLAREIRHQILVLPFYSVFDYISFSLEGSKVTLTGHVLRHSLREQAEIEMKDIDGVTAVVNQIEVLPTSPSDDELRRAIYRALYEDPSLAHYATQNVPPVRIIVKNGAVALEGTTDSLADKNLAAARASAVPNIVSVKNNLVVHPKESAAE